MYPYQNNKLSTEERITDLLSRMTPEEKIGQMVQLDELPTLMDDIKKKHGGGFANMLDLKLAKKIQKFCLTKTRMKIPFIFEFDAIHGHAFFPGTTVFPTQLAMSGAFDRKVVFDMAVVSAKEAYVTGVHDIFSPVLCLPRDMRWGRVDETFGEDPFLIGELGVAAVKGYQGKGIGQKYKVACSMKHYAGYAESRGGRDGSESDHGKRKMLSLFLPPFEKVGRAGCYSTMIAYHNIDGISCVANKWLLTHILRDKFHFKGFARTDWNNSDMMVYWRYTAKDLHEAYERSVNAGTDMVSCSPKFLDVAPELYKQGKISLERIDEACGRILRLKFDAGLFDDKKKCFPDDKEMKKFLNCKVHRKVALNAARKSMVLLKNNGVLPLKASAIKKLAIVGGNADDKVATLGSWSWLFNGSWANWPHEHKREDVVTLVDGVKKILGEKKVQYAMSCDSAPELNLSLKHAANQPVPKHSLVRKPTNLDEALDAAKDSDVIVACVGDHITISGEGRERVDLGLSNDQTQLLKLMKNLNKPLVVVLINSKPLTIPWVFEMADAVVEAWNPGNEGGNAIAEVLFGKLNPSAKLTVSWPKHVGQQPVCYNQTPGWHGRSTYVEVDKDPLFPFGFGLSYTTYKYSNLKVNKMKFTPDETIEVSVEVKNTGKMAGTEIVQLYVDDLVSTVSTPIKELKGFARVDLKPGQKKTVKLTVPVSELWLINENFEKAVEAGEFEIMVGASSMEKDLLVKKITVNESKVLERYE